MDHEICINKVIRLIEFRYFGTQRLYVYTLSENGGFSI